MWKEQWKRENKASREILKINMSFRGYLSTGSFSWKAPSLLLICLFMKHLPFANQDEWLCEWHYIWNLYPKWNVHLANCLLFFFFLNKKKSYIDSQMLEKDWMGVAVAVPGGWGSWFHADLGSSEWACPPWESPRSEWMRCGAVPAVSPSRTLEELVFSLASSLA